MLIQFSVKNYKTFANEVKISMVASKDDTLEDKNVFDSGFGYKLLKTAVVYGANASGKTKLIEAMGFMQDLVENSGNYQSNQGIIVEPFWLNTKTEKAPSMFEIIFIYENEMYRYGFEVTTEKIISEWLFVRQNNGKPKEVELFYRHEQNFEFHKTKFKIKDLVDNNRIKPNSLLLSVADAANESTANKVFTWLLKHLRTGSDKVEDIYLSITAQSLKSERNKNIILHFLSEADLGIKNLTAQEVNWNDISPETREKILKLGGVNYNLPPKIETLHLKYNENNELLEQGVNFLMQYHESAGTNKYFALSAPILISLTEGDVLAIDELDAKLHPNLVMKIVELFNSPKTNPKNAQLIFNTHNTNLLSPDAELFRRDQIWFVEKDHYGSANLYSLADFKTDTVRKADNYEKNYISGRYGAIPFLGDFDKLFNQ